MTSKGLRLAGTSERRTEDLAQELLRINGWRVQKPPKGQVIRQNEYKGHPSLERIFAGQSKTGTGDAYPDFLAVSDGLQPLLVVETKSEDSKVGEAIDEACHYGDACRTAGAPVVAVGIAGQEDSVLEVRVRKHINGAWEPVTYQGQPIEWMPRPSDVDLLLSSPDLIDLEPSVPDRAVLAEKADLLNRILREAKVRDEKRPAYIGAFMLALWQSKGQVRRNPQFVLGDINRAAEEAFARGGKQKLAKSLHIDEANQKLAATAWQIISELILLNVVSASFAHDYLGQLYEEFFRYTGGNTIGQYFTPRHVTQFMADLCETQPDDVVIDPACGTGGFLIAAIERAQHVGKVSYERAIEIVRDNLIGYESEPVTAALCVANMILRGDGKTGIHNADTLSAKDFPVGKCQVALMNPPFPHRKTDTPSERFVERALEALDKRGRLAVILPTSLLAKNNDASKRWRTKILKSNTLKAVCSLPDELFEPYASTHTCVVVLEKGVAHDPKRKTAFVRITHDGLRLRKGVRVEKEDEQNQLPDATNAVLNHQATPGFSGLAGVALGGEWFPGGYIESAPASEAEILEGVDELLRRLTAFYGRYAREVVVQRKRVKAGDLKPRPYRDMVGAGRIKNAAAIARNKGTIGEHFDLFYGQKELHSREGIAPGGSLIISPTEAYNGCYGWLEFADLIQPNFVTVAQTGSIGEAFVQVEPCGVNDDCLVLLPKDAATSSRAHLFVAAATIRAEKWRFNYGRKLTPSRIADFKFPITDQLLKEVERMIVSWEPIWDAMCANYSAAETEDA